jgi:hypothetical protein
VIVSSLDIENAKVIVEEFEKNIRSSLSENPGLG